MSAPEDRRRHVAVVGGGISGLAAAWALADAGVRVTLFEGSGSVGGKLRVEEVGGIPVDVGAEAMLARRPEGVELVRAAGLGDELIEPLTTSARVRAGGALHPLPARTMMGIPSDVETARASGTLTEHALRRIAEEPELDPLPPLDGDVAVGTLVRSRLGNEVADRLVEPLLGGVYAGRADLLSLRATVPALAARLADGGSLVRAAAAAAGGGGTRAAASGPVFQSVTGGLGRLPQTLAASGRFEVRTGTPVRAIRRTPDGFVLDVGATRDAESVSVDGVVVAVPAAKAAKLLAEVARSAATELGAVESASMAVVTFALRDAVLPEGSGLLVGAGEGLAVKGVTISTQKWPMPSDGLALVRASVGRIGEQVLLQRPDEELVALVRAELGTLLGSPVDPVDARVTRWAAGLPQYGVGHLDRVARVRAAVDRVPGLGVCGAAFDGLGVPACIAAARSAADRVVASIGRGGE